MRAHVRTWFSTDFSRIRLIKQNLAEVDQAGRIRQNLVKASEFICRVFHRDIPTITGLVPLQNSIVKVQVFYARSYIDYIGILEACLVVTSFY